MVVYLNQSFELFFIRIPLKQLHEVHPECFLNSIEGVQFSIYKTKTFFKKKIFSIQVSRIHLDTKKIFFKERFSFLNVNLICRQFIFASNFFHTMRNKFSQTHTNV